MAQFWAKRALDEMLKREQDITGLVSGSQVDTQLVQVNGQYNDATDGLLFIE